MLEYPLELRVRASFTLDVPSAQHRASLEGGGGGAPQATERGSAHVVKDEPAAPKDASCIY